MRMNGSVRNWSIYSRTIFKMKSNPRKDVIPFAPVTKYQEAARIIKNCNYRAAYYRITLQAIHISSTVQAGQFVYLQIPDSPLLLRRPFSIYDVDPEKQTLSLIYKAIGSGTKQLASLSPRRVINLLGPLGNGFSNPRKEAKAVIIVAGGYGCAATYLIAKHASLPGLCILGARSMDDILMEDEFRSTGFKVFVATEDGSKGHKGLVTDLLVQKLDRYQNDDIVIYACGPNAMLKAVAQIATIREIDTFLSIDMHMCCGVGACFTCVVKVKADNPDGWDYSRSCCEGPVYTARQLYWDGMKHPQS